ncbi:DNA cytosine methyltransferase [Mesomycoplasma hyorhinis]|uniref:DNA cytosine methyltransferase n=1 Tax=Mesomycoplasma hyorhinis TaxID=2100 RepID=UPI001C05AA58|nr:DNA (cytosine-5-)-methyltransferase [Mesomycoplasma hyorhinis]
MKKLRIATVFSGIGAAEQALEKMKIKYDVVFACDNGDIKIKNTEKEIKQNIFGMSQNQINNFVKQLYLNTGKTNYVKQSYVSNYKISEENWYDDIRFLDGNEYKNQVDLFVGGSPCQSFSIMGKKAGLKDARGTLFYEFARLVKQIQPKVFIYENVPGMLSHDKGNTWKTIKNIFLQLGYKIHDSVLNSKDFGIPQNRKRLFVIGFKDKNVDFQFPKEIKLDRKMYDFLESKVDSKYYLGRKGFEFVTNYKYKNRARVNSEIIQTQKANQQFNWNGDFVFEPVEKVVNNSEIMKRAYVSQWNGNLGVIRQLSHRECLRLMGFSDSFKIVVPNVQAYRQAGNSIVVDVLEAIYKEIFKLKQL